MSRQAGNGNETTASKCGDGRGCHEYNGQPGERTRPSVKKCGDGRGCHEYNGQPGEQTRPSVKKSIMSCHYKHRKLTRRHIAGRRRTPMMDLCRIVDVTCPSHSLSPPSTVHLPFLPLFYLSVLVWKFQLNVKRVLFILIHPVWIA